MTYKAITGKIFDIKKYAIHDGSGIRTTVFFKGCPLECWWCHNPESQAFNSEFMIYNDRCINECDLCVKSCHVNAIEKTDNNIVINYELCDFCGECESICPSDAIKIVGKDLSVNEVIKEVEKDILFFDESSGGITISGGEPMIQIDFLENLLKESKKGYLRTIVDTSGYCDFKNFERLNQLVDLYFYDIKLIDDKLHKHYTGVSNKIILSNFKKLIEINNEIEVRIPLIKGITTNNENIKDIVEFLLNTKFKGKVTLLNYHSAAISKYKRIGKKYRLMDLQPLSDSEVNTIANKF